MEQVKDELIEMLSGDPAKLYGTLLRKSGTLGVYWSPRRYKSPSDAITFDGSDWLYIGTEGWYQDAEMKDIFTRFKEISPDWPQHPGEYVDLTWILSR